MATHELRDPDEARRYLLQSLWLQRVLPPRPATVAAAIEWALELIGGGEPLPPLGFVADVGHAIFQTEVGQGKEHLHVPGWPEGLARTYEDYVLGKLYADSSFERAGDALRHYRGRDQARGLAFLVTQFRQRAGFGGVHLSPAIIKAQRERPADEVLAEGWDSFSADGPMPLLVALYEELVTQVRHSAGVLGPEDVFELEHRTALAAFSQRVALRQVLQACAVLEAGLPAQGIRPRVRRHEVPTRILDEDMYPVGGFSSISTRGSIESLLHSQLAYMEKERPDLFDIKYLRDELFYYSRDENQFLRRRRTFVFALYPDLVEARFKDAELPWQRIVLVLGLMLAAVHKLIELLSEDALVFEFIFIHNDDTRPLAAEQALVEMILREQIANGTALIANLPAGQLVTHSGRHARRSLCHLLNVATTPQPLQIDSVRCATLTVADARPVLVCDDDSTSDPDGILDAWTAALERLIEQWI
jgi:vWA domain found in the FtsH ternary systems/N-terminal helical region fused to the FtsH ternary system vWA domain